MGCRSTWLAFGNATSMRFSLARSTCVTALMPREVILTRRVAADCCYAIPRPRMRQLISKDLTLPFKGLDTVRFKSKSREKLARR